MAKYFKKIGLCVALIGALLLGSSTPLPARDRDDKCERRVQKAEQNLREAERRHGEHSKQAEQRRRQLEDARSKCHHDGDRDHDRDHH